MELFNRKKYFIVFYRGIKNRGVASMETRIFLNYDETIKNLLQKVEGETKNTLVLTGIIKISKKEYNIWHYGSKN
jgi:hypothetical protein